jgi:hypothetical protein
MFSPKCKIDLPGSCRSIHVAVVIGESDLDQAVVEQSVDPSHRPIGECIARISLTAIRTVHPIASQFFDNLLEPVVAPTMDRLMPDPTSKILSRLVAIELPS